MNCPTAGVQESGIMSCVTSLFLSCQRYVCFNVSVEPHLQPLTGETFTLASANVDDGVHLDVAASGFWEVAINKFS